MKAADAAAAPDPRVTRQAGEALRGQLVERVERAKVTTAGVKRGGKRFGEAIWGPFAKAGGILWLEVTGVLFGMFALVTGGWAWGHRADLFAAGVVQQREWIGLGLFVLFAYFTVSSYTRASKRSR